MFAAHYESQSLRPALTLQLAACPALSTCDRILDVCLWRWRGARVRGTLDTKMSGSDMFGYVACPGAGVALAWPTTRRPEVSDRHLFW